MCGRFSLRASAADLLSFFGLVADDRASLEAIGQAGLPRYNIAPGQPVLTARLGERGERRLDLLHWGLMPAWSRGELAEVRKQSYRMINARAETAWEKPSFRAAISRRRCLVPTSGFYEWGAGKGAGRPATLIHRPDGSLFALGGIWERWEGAEGEVHSLSLLTIAADGPVAALHDRMPVVLAPAQFQDWLSGDRATAEALMLPDLQLQLDPVGNTVNNARHEGPECWGDRAAALDSAQGT